jgi:hypothetical protein
MYLRIINDTITYPYTIQQLKLDNPNVTFPENLTEAILIEWGMFSVQQTVKPNDYTKNISEGTPQLVDGIYNQTWNESNSSEEEINIRIENKWIEIRNLRDQLLLESDWTQLADSPQITNNDWKAYRQYLRDITSQSNPFDISWPTKP